MQSALQAIIMVDDCDFMGRKNDFNTHNNAINEDGQDTDSYFSLN